MPQVPIIAVPSVMPGPAPGRPQQLSTNPDMFGAGVGRALSGVGQEVAQLGVVLQANRDRLQNERDTADANEAFLSASIEKGQTEAAYFALEGKNATDAYPAFVSDLEGIRKRHLDMMGTDKAKKLFDNEFTRSCVFSINDGSKHAAAENKKFVSDASLSRVQLAINDSATRFNDEGAFKTNLQSIDEQINALGSSEGWSPEKLALEKKNSFGKAYAARIREMAIYSPFGADQLFTANKDKILPDDAIVLETAIRTSKNNLGVRTVADQIAGGGGVARPGFSGAVLGAPIEFKWADGSAVDRNNPTLALNPDLTNRISMAAQAIGLPYLSINSEKAGFATSGHVKNSEHYHHNAIDLYVGGMPIPERLKFLHALSEAGITGLGIGNNIIHADVGGRRSWGYNADGSWTSEAPEWARSFTAAHDAGKLYTGAGPAGTNAGGLVNKIYGLETSFGRNVRTSSAGAEGPLQVMPATGKLVAAALGIPFSLHALKYDHSYGMLLGTTYLNMMLKQFGGNETLAAAAYNAGPGRVNEWIRKFGDPNSGSISNEEWASKIPIAETRNYVLKTLGAVAGGGVSATYTPSGRKSLSTLLTEGQNMARQIAPFDPTFEDNLLSRIRTDYSIQTTADEESQTAAYNLVGSTALGEGLASPPTNIDELLVDKATRAAYESLDAEKKITIHNLLEKNAKADAPETPKMAEHFYELKGMQQTDPEGFKKYDVWKDEELNLAFKKKIAELQAAPQKSSAEQRINLNSYLQVARSPLDALGLWPNTDNKDSRPQYNAFVGAFSDRLTESMMQTKKRPTDAEALQIASDLLQKTTLAPIEVPGFNNDFGGGEVYNFELNKKELMKQFGLSSEVADVVVLHAEVPVLAEAAIAKQYTEKTGKEATPEIIRQIYLRAQKEIKGGAK